MRRFSSEAAPPGYAGTKSHLVREILRRYTTVELFAEPRRRLKPYAEKAGYLTEEHSFRDFLVRMFLDTNALLTPFGRGQRSCKDGEHISSVAVATVSRGAGAWWGSADDDIAGFAPDDALLARKRRADALSSSPTGLLNLPWRPAVRG